MKPSDITLLRKELAKAAAENRNLQKKIFEIEATPTKRNTLLELEDDCLRRELAARDMRMETYENSDAPLPSTGSLYNSERAAFRKKMEEGDMREDGPEPNGEYKTRKGPPAGHAGASHGNKAERTVTL